MFNLRMGLSCFIFLAISALGIEYVDDKLMLIISKDYRMVLCSIVLLIALLVTIIFNVIIHIIKKEKYKSKIPINDIPREFEDLYKKLHKKHIWLLELKRIKYL